MSMLDLQEKFVIELADSIPPGWQSLYIHYEYATVDGEHHENFFAKRIDMGRESRFQMPLDALNVLVELNDKIPDSQSEKWTAVDITIEDSGKFRFDFHYGMPPFVAQFLGKQQA